MPFWCDLFLLVIAGKTCRFDLLRQMMCCGYTAMAVQEVDNLIILDFVVPGIRGRLGERSKEEC